jgi:hypothetical protein
MPMRMRGALRYFLPSIGKAIRWTFTSREFANYTFDLTETNISYLAHTISVATGVDFLLAKDYLREIQADDSVKRHVQNLTASSGMKHSSDPTCYFGRRIGWYAFVRILKPKLVVETGVERGHGAIAICSALMRNQAEGYDGKYLGTDKDPNAGFLFTKPYSDFGKILYGDSIESLKTIRNIDLFINDSDHSADYEYREYRTIADSLTPDAVILGDNAHVSDSLQRFSEERDRHFLFFKENPKDHWYPGAGIGISFGQSVFKFDRPPSSDPSCKVR